MEHAINLRERLMIHFGSRRLRARMKAQSWPVFIVVVNMTTSMGCELRLFYLIDTPHHILSAGATFEFSA